jgi:hypothetical protein
MTLRQQMLEIKDAQDQMVASHVAEKTSWNDEKQQLLLGMYLSTHPIP